MTKKDYELIAEVIKSETKLQTLKDEFGNKSYEKRICPYDFITALSMALKKDNQNFDSFKWHSACANHNPEVLK
tara:strand:- start:196 stop:417 length:222 start_codon:yes stop_codon:yes gene_type:complete